MHVKIGGLTVYVTFSFAVFLAFAANIAGGRRLLLSLLFSFVHEAIHLIFLYFSGIKRAEIRLLPAGIKICCKGINMLSYKKTVFTVLSAPVFNLLAGAVFFFLHNLWSGELFYSCSAINFILGLVNLLPLSFLDGGRAIEAVLSVKTDNERTAGIMKSLGMWSVALLFLLFFVGFIAGRVQIFLLFFCVYCLMGTLSSKSNLY